MQLVSAVEDLPRTSNVRTQLMALWITAISMAIMAVAYALYPGFWPPMSPQLSAQEVADFYRDNAGWIRFSMVTFNLCGIMLLPLFCVIVVQIKRMATPSQAFAYCYLMATVSGGTLFAFSAIFFATAVFRPDRDADLVLVLNDLGWIVFVAPVGMALVQNLMLAMAIYFDNGPQPVYPRWVAHFSVIVALAMAPSAFSMTVMSGPFAWNGAISFWLRNIAFGTYLVVMLVVTWQAVHRQAAEEGLTV
ncbi:hypothetical protein BST36_08985 [Mycolicibacterium moriokaense]|jgi:hypothetical protein|uniref:Uncharacterized protein n=1 Tax=Mycolicibacterium moriokaense TaxID=39691 RepID=A0AAD1HGD5_9MYCO|nr:hypothetical protein [Mycolicibacterium moriokaense]MCV7042112.1 hypothetical protein [Mycolicibacterium moriokaense]ORB25180.1 hypothetical protein BST36_08985 [Mycolicibacterium moriokaense]BBX04882.1 hypothetical protein MMOR_58180 [Mycolicibacterium moriokaense]